MAKIMENSKGRRTIRLSADDVISIVREYQTSAGCGRSCAEIRKLLEKREFYLPEDI